MESIEEVASLAEEQSAINEDCDLTEKLFYSLKLNMETLAIEEDNEGEMMDETIVDEIKIDTNETNDEDYRNEFIKKFLHVVFLFAAQIAMTNFEETELQLVVLLVLVIGMYFEIWTLIVLAIALGLMLNFYRKHEKPIPEPPVKKS